MKRVIREARNAQEYGEISRLIAEYVLWLRACYANDNWFISEILDKQSLNDELGALPQMYGPPNGRAFIAVNGNEVLGCGAYRRLDATTCEMKRVFVPSQYQGAGIGRDLCNALILAAQVDGYASMKLDTGKILTQATGLYRSLGFAPCPVYYDYPDKLLPYLVFLERPLGKPPEVSH